MIIYENDLKEFIVDVSDNLIVDKILDKFYENGFNKDNCISEINSWNNSLQFMKNILEYELFSRDVYVAIEYAIPRSSKRIDFMLFGLDETKKRNYVILELKQWRGADDSGKNDVVLTFVGNRKREVLHPSYQSKEYLYLLENFNKYISEKNVLGQALAYLHNASKKENSNLLNECLYKSISDCPVFFKDDVKELREKLVRLVGNGKGREILYNIENSEVCPSKNLIDSVSNLFKNRDEFLLIDSQKTVYENIISKINDIDNVFIVNGNPGTGKSIVALNLFKTLIENKKIVNYVTPNASFRECLIHNLKNNKSKNDNYKELFKWSGSYLKSVRNDYDWLIVDEAHRLSLTDAPLYFGKNQIEDLLKASKNVVFFVDEKQVVRPSDIGTNENIEEIAKLFNKKIYSGNDYFLETQFRCSGADGYINALDTVLQIKETANRILNDNNKYEFKIFDSPNELLEKINEKISEGFTKSKILAGYAWKWNSKNFNRDEMLIKNAYDIEIEGHDFKGFWNYKNDKKWAISEETNGEIGCVYTSQGLEFEYCGVIIGNDLQINSENNSLFGSYKNFYDVKAKKGLKNNPKKLTSLIKNIYKILLTRGQMGTYVYICDDNLRNYFKKFIK